MLAGPDSPKAKGVSPEAEDAILVDEGVAAIESPERSNHQNGGSGTKEIYHEDIRAEI